MVSVVAGMGEYFYNLSFMVYIYFIIKNSLTGRSIPSKRFHFVSLGLSFTYLAYEITFNKLGLTP